MGKKIDLTGQRFGRLRVIKETEKRNRNGGNVIWLCECDCGAVVEVSSENLRRGATKSCGCYNRDIITKENPKYKRKLYSIYHSIKNRCRNQHDKAYKNYGGRGINLSDKWDTYEKFEQWAMDNGYQEGLWLDRIDNDGDYSPENCRFCTPKEQQNNKRTNIFVEINGERKTIQQWAEASGIKRATIERRIELGWNADDLLNPIDKRYSHGEKIKRAKENPRTEIEIR